MLRTPRMIELPIIDTEAPAQEASGPREVFWRSLGHLKHDPAFRKLAQQEFMAGAGDAPGGSSRRQFLQLMGASMALAGLTACNRPVAHTLPYARKPEEIIPGIPLFYATAMPFRGSLRGLLVESHEGRPTKIEGNPQHPLTQGATSVFEQGSVLGLYDPDRSRSIVFDGNEAAWNDFVRAGQQFAQGGSRRVAVLIEETSSLTVSAIREKFRQQFPEHRWVTYAAEGDDPERQGMQLAFGRPLRPLYRFEEAEVILSLDADFLGPVDRNMIHNTRSFARSRRLEGVRDEMSRLYVVESAYTLTGGMADHRQPLRASEIPAFAAAVAAQLGIGGQGGAFANDPFVVAVAQELQRAGARGLVLAGETQPPDVHALCAAINSALGSVGSTVTLLDTGEEPAQQTQSEALRDLVSDMKAGAIDALLMIGVNPVYDAPPELDFSEALQRVPLSIHLGLHLDETARASRWHIPRTHYLEAWGDGRAYDGTLSVVQPLIAPLYKQARSEIELLNTFATGLDVPGYDLVRETWRPRLSGDFEQAWRRVLHDGYAPDSGFPAVVAAAGGLTLSARAAVPENALEVVFRLDPSVLDGSFANNAWLQELPDPVTKVVWDNVAAMSRATAEELGLSVDYEEGKFYSDVIEIIAGDWATPLPVWIVPGYPDRSIGVSFGYGRDIKTLRPPVDVPFFDSDVNAGPYGRGALANGVGQNVAPLRTTLMERVLVGAQVRKGSADRYMVSTTQEHGSMEGRPIVRMAALETYRQNPDFVDEAVEPIPGTESFDDFPALWEERHPTGEPAYRDDLYYRNQWGMVIDLNTCTGCNACVVACVSENNIQVVGKDEVSRGREMYWLRIDRYFVSQGEGEHGEDEVEEADLNPRMVVQPMLCVHCENAPCEPVCPVAATSHSPDGINEMTYNRCIGTRYCANNCPYKVRRFNYYNWSKMMPLEVEMAQNPHVTVRFRGVMEKCTYCVQRVREVQRRANVEDRRIADGEVITACQQACPAEAIVFGDLNDPNSKVSIAKQNSRKYEVLEVLNTRPRTSYLGRVYNPNQRLTEGVV